MTDTPTAAEAITYAERVFAHYGWTLSRGRIEDGEPLFAFLVYPATDGIMNDVRPIACREHDNPMRCVFDAACDLDLASPALN